MLLFYIRIFAVRRFRMICWAIVAFNIAHLISIIFSTCFICRSMMYRFDKTIPNGHCGDLVSFGLYRNHHPDIRRHGRGTADANAVGAPNADEEEIGLSCVFGMGAM
jgi:hypothetical protein